MFSDIPRTSLPQCWHQICKPPMTRAKQHLLKGSSPPPLVYGVREAFRLEGIFVGRLVQSPAQSRTSFDVRSVHSGLFPVKLWIPPGMDISQPPRAPCLLFDHSQGEFPFPPPYQRELPSLKLGSAASDPFHVLLWEESGSALSIGPP